jgi:hypothetical protein
MDRLRIGPDLIYPMFLRVFGQLLCLQRRKAGEEELSVRFLGQLERGARTCALLLVAGKEELHVRGFWQLQRARRRQCLRRLLRSSRQREFGEFGQALQPDILGIVIESVLEPCAGGVPIVSRHRLIALADTIADTGRQGLGSTRRRKQAHQPERVFAAP